MKLSAAMTVRDLLYSHPETFAVLVGRGMCEDCKADPPPVLLEHFAEKHCDGDLDGLLDELRRAIDQGAAR